MTESDLPFSTSPKDGITPWDKAGELQDRKLFPEEAQTTEGRRLAANFVRTLASEVMADATSFSKELRVLTSQEVLQAYTAYLDDVRSILGSPQQPFTLSHAVGAVRRIVGYFQDEEDYYETPTAYRYEKRAYETIASAIQQASEAQVNEAAQKVTLYVRDLGHPHLYMDAEDAPTQVGRSLAFMSANSLIDKVRRQRIPLRSNKKPLSVIDVIDFFQKYREGESVDITLQQVRAVIKRKQLARKLEGNFTEDTQGVNYKDIINLGAILDEAIKLQSKYGSDQQ
jgi:hypothetical protein